MNRITMTIALMVGIHMGLFGATGPTKGNNQKLIFNIALNKITNENFSLYRGSDINYHNADGISALSMALMTSNKQNNLIPIKLLVKSGSDVRGIIGKLTLRLAIEKKDKELENLLIEKGVTDFDEPVKNVQELIKDYENSLGDFFSESDTIFTQEISKRFDKDSNKELNNAREDVFILLSTQGSLHADRFYKAIHDIYQKNELEARGLDFVSKKYFYLELAKRAVSPSKRKDWVDILLPFCKGNIFTSKQGSFEFEVKEVINSLNPKDKLAIKKELEKKYDKKMFSAQQGNRLTDIGFKFQ